MNYQQVTFFTQDAAQHEILIAMLENIGYEGFEEQADSLIASIPQASYQREEVAALAAQLQLSFTEETILPQNWNALWEAGFEPVVVDDFCTVRASFHEVNAKTEHEIIITPKMSFGTGHHATTQLMIEGMRAIDFKGRDVLDFGTGTGILAILAKKLGAASVTAIDHDEWSVTNATENAAMNDAEIILDQASLEDIAAAQYDMILANINRNILLEHMSAMSGQIRSRGVLLLSGILETDEQAITEAAIANNLDLPQPQIKNGWMAIRFTKR